MVTSKSLLNNCKYAVFIISTISLLFCGVSNFRKVNYLFLDKKASLIPTLNKDNQDNNLNILNANNIGLSESSIDYNKELLKPNSESKNLDTDDNTNLTIQNKGNFEKLNIERFFYNKDASGSVQSFKINVNDTSQVKLIDLSVYEADSFAFKWEKGSFEYGLSTSLSLPILKNVEINDDIDESQNFLVSNLIVFKENKYLFIKASEKIENLTIDIISPNIQQTTGRVNAIANHNSGAKYSSLGIIPREVWSNDPEINNPNRLVWDPYYYKVNKIVIHHTATDKDNPIDPIIRMRSIYNYHRITCGWGDIGYNYLIDQYGNIYEGKLGGDEAKGYHAGSANANSIGISLIGDFTNVLPTQAAQDALVRLIAEKASLFDFTPNYLSTVYGHRDVAATGCPGNAFYPLLSNTANSARSYKDNNFSYIKTIVNIVDNDLNKSIYRNNLIDIVFNNPSEISVPSWSGIGSYYIIESTVPLKITDASTPYESVIDRIRTLYIIFLLEERGEGITLRPVNKGWLVDE
jgi:hypothetical protein